MKSIFKRKKLLTDKKFNLKLVGYARSINTEIDYLNEQINSLESFGCDLIFSEVISLKEKNKPQFRKALDCLSKGDELVLTRLDRAFQSKYECVKAINKLLNKDINVRTLSGLFCSNNSQLLGSFFTVLEELEILERDNLLESKKESVYNRKILGENLGGRPKISPVKESLVIRLRAEGCSYRSIKTQTGIALSTIRRILIDSKEI